MASHPQARAKASGVAAPAVPPIAQALAWRDLAPVSGPETDPEALADTAERAYTALRRRLIGLIGRDGFAALLNRALRLARIVYPTLEGITLDNQAETGLRGIREYAQTQAGDGAAAGGLAAILAQLIGLLVVFIGEDLAVRLVQDAWPHLAGETAERGAKHG